MQGPSAEINSAECALSQDTGFQESSRQGPAGLVDALGPGTGDSRLSATMLDDAELCGERLFAPSPHEGPKNCKTKVATATTRAPIVASAAQVAKFGRGSPLFLLLLGDRSGGVGMFMRSVEGDVRNHSQDGL